MGSTFKPLRGIGGIGMRKYYVNKKKDDGYHEVHREGVVRNGEPCPREPKEENRVPLGRHPSCKEAVKAAKKHFANLYSEEDYKWVDGCKRCCPDCHTR